jgi:hypothetical protein
MAKSGKKKSKKPKPGKFGFVMTNKIRLIFIGCAVFGFVGMAIILLWK